MSDQQAPDHKSGDNTFWKWTGNIGNVVGIVGVVTSILAGKTYLVILFVAVVGVSVGIWLMRLQWQRTAVAFLVVGLLSGLGAISAMSQSGPEPRSQPVADQSSSTASPEASVDSTSSSSTSSSSAPAAPGKATPKPLVDQQITLEPGQAIDVDLPNQPPTVGQSGAVGAFDLFWSSASTQLLSQDGFYSFSGSPNNAYRDCKKSLDPATANSNSYQTSIYVYLGYSHCFATSDHHIGWVRIDNKNVDGSTTINSVLRVRVWDK